MGDPRRAAGAVLLAMAALFAFAGPSSWPRADAVAELMRAARGSLAMAVVAASIATLIGTAWGLLPLGWITGTLLALPALGLAAALAGTGASWARLAVALGLACWPPVAWAVRERAAAVRARGFMDAARSAGAGRVRLLVRHVLPGTARAIGAGWLLSMGAAAVIEAGLGLGGLDAKGDSLGRLLAGPSPGAALGVLLAVCLAVRLTTGGRA
ncbi:hypothetical protein Afil01_65940 [Actinorhabdospora filicis]|uniref:ABC transmembrane type-1 domain-containing protein n=1 Tax=Actinorhabdospora filicis TaxID=1785913 RepID=A0A9W6W6P9_9ACTN|nr:ABC transporter permease subunit [Actinorhabdospora filicis]GLZ81787.1 hypothetical protein Afil01_65940 [Actinorhabdospora filicis]